jgi:hypothetical protein
VTARGLESWHCQTTNTRKPSDCRPLTLRASRERFAANFVVQKALFEAGTVASLQRAW